MDFKNFLPGLYSQSRQSSESLLQFSVATMYGLSRHVPYVVPLIIMSRHSFCKVSSN